MPLGFERLNERQQRPNALINFIKPLPGPDQATSEEFLSRIAAQCYPVMKKHHISVMALQEHEPNNEFLGRNFNAGEVIELVLKDKAGRWLSMKFVQMVMMHELAHCKQMNHSKYFWGVRNEYAAQMEELWRQKYTGEGMWGRGRGLENGSFVDAAPPDNSLIPERLCGGSYRRRGRKRKIGTGGGEQEKLSYAERQQRRIARKFGKHGDGASLGEDDLLRGALESMSGGKRSQGKPRVANSKRGRELRAAAALARFEQAKREPPPEEKVKVEGLDSDTESDWEDGAAAADEGDAVVIKDEHGRDLVKVCGEGEDDEEDAGREMDELRMLSTSAKGKPVPAKSKKKPARGQEGHQDSETESETEEPQRGRPPAKVAGAGEEGHQDSETESEIENLEQIRRPTKTAKGARSPVVQIHSDTTDEEPQPATNVDGDDPPIPADQVDLLRQIDASNAASQTGEADATDHVVPHADMVEDRPAMTDNPLTITNPPISACPICSVENEANALTCIVCSHVLRPKLMPNHWKCTSDACKGSKYINAGDVGLCPGCGARKPKNTLAEDAGGRPIGITRPEVLRWD